MGESTPDKKQKLILVIHSQLQLLLNICPSFLPTSTYTCTNCFKKGVIIYLFRDYQMQTGNFVKKRVDPSFNLFERGVAIFLGEPLFINVTSLAYGSLKFETLVQLCIFIKDILIVDYYNITNSIEFVSIDNAYWDHALSTWSTSQRKSLDLFKLS